ncbi:ABC transporter permease [Tsukamurella serpentis]
MITRAIGAELVKITTVRATKWLLLGSMAAALALTVVTALVVRNVGETISDVGAVALGPLTGFGGLPGLAITFAAVIGVLSVTTEIRYNTLRSTFLAIPRRWLALSAKTLVVAVVCALAYAAVMIVCVVVFGVIVDGSPLFAFGSGAAFLFTFPVATAISAVLGVAVGCAVRNGAGAITLLLGYLFVVDNVVAAIPQTRDAGPYLLLSNLQNFLGVLMNPEFPWSATVSAVYLVAVVGLLWVGAVALISRRDV